MLRVLLIVIVFLIAGFAIYAFLKRRSKQEAESDIEVDDKTYTLELMTAFVKRRLDEITKINLYDIGLSEEELKRRKQKKYELKKAFYPFSCFSYRLRRASPPETTIWSSLHRCDAASRHFDLL